MRARAVLLALVLVATSACTDEGVIDPAVRAKDAGVPIPNFARIGDGVYRGSQPDAAGFKALKDLGVKTVINLREKHDDAPLASPYGIEVINMPMHARLSVDPPGDDEVRTFFAAVMDPARRPVFFHCAQGMDRTGTMCALYRIEVDGWTTEKAHEEMASFGWHDELYRGLGKFVLGYKSRGFGKPAPR